MKIYDDLTPALQTVLLHWTRGYTCWTSTEPLPRAKAEMILRGKWTETYGTSLPAWKRQDRKQKGLPNAVALGVPVVGLPEHLQLILMATQDAQTAPQVSPFSREKWAPRRLVWNPTITMVGRSRGRWACGQGAKRLVHMSTGRY